MYDSDSNLDPSSATVDPDAARTKPRPHKHPLPLDYLALLDLNNNDAQGGRGYVEIPRRPPQDGYFNIGAGQAANQGTRMLGGFIIPPFFSLSRIVSKAQHEPPQGQMPAGNFFGNLLSRLTSPARVQEEVPVVNIEHEFDVVTGTRPSMWEERRRAQEFLDGYLADCLRKESSIYTPEEKVQMRTVQDTLVREKEEERAMEKEKQEEEERERKRKRRLKVRKVPGRKGTRKENEGKGKKTRKNNAEGEGQGDEEEATLGTNLSREHPLFARAFREKVRIYTPSGTEVSVDSNGDVSVVDGARPPRRSDDDADAMRAIREENERTRRKLRGTTATGRPPRAATAERPRRRRADYGDAELELSRKVMEENRKILQRLQIDQAREIELNRMIIEENRRTLRRIKMEKAKERLRRAANKDVGHKIKKTCSSGVTRDRETGSSTNDQSNTRTDVVTSADVIGQASDGRAKTRNERPEEKSSKKPAKAKACSTEMLSSKRKSSRRRKPDRRDSVESKADEAPVAKHKEKVVDDEGARKKETKPEAKDQKTNKPEAKDQKTNKPEAKDQKTIKPEAKDQKTNKPEAKEQKTNKPEAKEQKTNKPEAKEQKTNKPEVKDQKTKRLETKRPIAQRAESDFDDDYQSDDVKVVFHNKRFLEGKLGKRNSPKQNTVVATTDSGDVTTEVERPDATLVDVEPRCERLVNREYIERDTEIDVNCWIENNWVTKNAFSGSVDYYGASSREIVHAKPREEEVITRIPVSREIETRRGYRFADQGDSRCYIHVDKAGPGGAKPTTCERDVLESHRRDTRLGDEVTWGKKRRDHVRSPTSTDGEGGGYYAQAPYDYQPRRRCVNRRRKDQYGCGTALTTSQESMAEVSKQRSNAIRARRVYLNNRRREARRDVDVAKPAEQRGRDEYRQTYEEVQSKIRKWDLVLKETDAETSEGYKTHESVMALLKAISREEISSHGLEASMERCPGFGSGKEEFSPRGDSRVPKCRKVGLVVPRPKPSFHRRIRHKDARLKNKEKKAKNNVVIPETRIAKRGTIEVELCPPVQDVSLELVVRPPSKGREEPEKKVVDPATKAGANKEDTRAQLLEMLKKVHAKAEKLGRVRKMMEVMEERGDIGDTSKHDLIADMLLAVNLDGRGESEGFKQLEKAVERKREDHELMLAKYGGISSQSPDECVQQAVEEPVLPTTQRGKRDKHGKSGSKKHVQFSDPEREPEKTFPTDHNTNDRREERHEEQQFEKNVGDALKECVENVAPTAEARKQSPSLEDKPPVEEDAAQVTRKKKQHGGRHAHRGKRTSHGVGSEQRVAHNDASDVRLTHQTEEGGDVAWPGRRAEQATHRERDLKVQIPDAGVEERNRYAGVEELNRYARVEGLNRDAKVEENIRDAKVEKIRETRAEGLNRDARAGGFNQDVRFEGLNRDARVEGLNRDMRFEALNRDARVAELNRDARVEGQIRDARFEGMNRDARVEGLNRDARVNGQIQDARFEGLNRDVRDEGQIQDARFEGLNRDTRFEGRNRDVRAEGQIQDARFEGLNRDTRFEGVNRDMRVEGLNRDARFEGLIRGARDEFMNVSNETSKSEAKQSIELMPDRAPGCREHDSMELRNDYSRTRHVDFSDNTSSTTSCFNNVRSKQMEEHMARVLAEYLAKKQEFQQFIEEEELMKQRQMRRDDGRENDACMARLEGFRDVGRDTQASAGCGAQERDVIRISKEVDIVRHVTTCCCAHSVCCKHVDGVVGGLHPTVHSDDAKCGRGVGDSKQSAPSTNTRCEESKQVSQDGMRCGTGTGCCALPSVVADKENIMSLSHKDVKPLEFESDKLKTCCNHKCDNVEPEAFSEQDISKQDYVVKACNQGDISKQVGSPMIENRVEDEPKVISLMAPRIRFKRSMNVVKENHEGDCFNDHVRQEKPMVVREPAVDNPQQALALSREEIRAPQQRLAGGCEGDHNCVNVDLARRSECVTRHQSGADVVHSTSEHRTEFVNAGPLDRETRQHGSTPSVVSNVREDFSREAKNIVETDSQDIIQCRRDMTCPHGDSTSIVSRIDTPDKAMEEIFKKMDDVIINRFLTLASINGITIVVTPRLVVNENAQASNEEFKDDSSEEKLEEITKEEFQCERVETKEKDRSKEEVLKVDEGSGTNKEVVYKIVSVNDKSEMFPPEVYKDEPEVTIGHRPECQIPGDHSPGIAASDKTLLDRIETVIGNQERMQQLALRNSHQLETAASCHFKKSDVYFISHVLCKSTGTIRRDKKAQMRLRRSKTTKTRSKPWRAARGKEARQGEPAPTNQQVAPDQQVAAETSANLRLLEDIALINVPDTTPHAPKVRRDNFDRCYEQVLRCLPVEEEEGTKRTDKEPVKASPKLFSGGKTKKADDQAPVDRFLESVRNNLDEDELQMLEQASRSTVCIPAERRYDNNNNKDVNVIYCSRTYEESVSTSTVAPNIRTIEEIIAEADGGDNLLSICECFGVDNIGDLMGRLTSSEDVKPASRPGRRERRRGGHLKARHAHRERRNRRRGDEGELRNAHSTSNSEGKTTTTTDRSTPSPEDSFESKEVWRHRRLSKVIDIDEWIRDGAVATRGFTQQEDNFVVPLKRKRGKKQTPSDDPIEDACTPLSQFVLNYALKSGIILGGAATRDKDAEDADADCLNVKIELGDNKETLIVIQVPEEEELKVAGAASRRASRLTAATPPHSSAQIVHVDSEEIVLSTETTEAAGAWSRAEQEAFRDALKRHPPTPRVWDRIARSVGRSKRDCVLHFMRIWRRLEGASGHAEQ